MLKILFIIFIYFVPACILGQLPKLYCVKFDPIGGLFGEFRFSYERKITHYKYVYASTGYYHNEDEFPDEKNVKPPSEFQALMTEFWTSPYNKFFYTSAGFFYRDYKIQREKILGPVARVGIKQYVKTKNAPEGLFFYMGINYAFLRGIYYNENYNIAGKIFIHKPGFTLSAGNQWLLGTKKTYAICLFGGAEYYYWALQPDNAKDHFWDTTPNFMIYLGCEVGFAFRQRKLHW
jgi:hypothetical protein